MADAPAAQRAAGVPMAVTDDTFKAEVLDCDIPVIVEFWGSWCNPCKPMKAVMEEIAQEIAGRARVVTMEWDRCPHTCAKYEVMSVPFILLFKGGEVVAVNVGFSPKAHLLGIVEPQLT